MKKPWELKYFRWADVIILLIIVVALFIGVQLAYHAPKSFAKETISLNIKYIPYYAGKSLLRMGAAYFLSMIFSLIYGYAAARNKTAEKVLLPIIDVLQSVPILSFLPVVVLSLAVILPQSVAAELASIVLIFTSQVWNLTFSWYQSLTTIPTELNEACNVFHLSPWMKFKKLELPFGFVSLIWNSIMSWAGGWFFLMAAEIFTVGQKQFQLIGLGSYLQAAANTGNLHAMFAGIFTLVLIIILLDQFVWRPFLTWAKKFNLQTVSGPEAAANSWFYWVLRKSNIIDRFNKRFFFPIIEKFDERFVKTFPFRPEQTVAKKSSSVKIYIGVAILGIALIYGLHHTIVYLFHLSWADWWLIAKSAFFSLLRVFAALALSMLWTIPVGVAIGSNQRLATFMQPLVQITASIPATALFPILILFLLHLPFGLNIAAIVLMMLGSQWYLLFNIIAGVNTIPQDLRYTASLMQLKKWSYWKNLILPALFPFLITGAITASGGAWNASIVAEYVSFNNRNYFTTGLGSLIAQSTAEGNYTMLLASTLTMVVIVTVINRLLWRRLYNVAKEKFTMQ